MLDKLAGIEEIEFDQKLSDPELLSDPQPTGRSLTARRAGEIVARAGSTCGAAGTQDAADVVLMIQIQNCGDLSRR